jgi:tetratricopeptide (TPR) repeat protein
MTRFRPKHKPARGRPASGDGALLMKVMAEAQAHLEADRFEEACQVLEANFARLANHAPMRAALATVYGGLGRTHDAAVQARMALDLDPKQPDYYALAALSYFAAGYFTFAHRARERWLALRPQGPMVDEIIQLEAEYRSEIEITRIRLGAKDLRTVEEAGYRLDEGRWSLDQQRWADALRHSQAASKLLPAWEPPRNNASTILYFLCRYAEAVAEAEHVLRDSPDNIHALSNLVRYYLTVGKVDEARACGDKLAALTSADLEHEAAGQLKRVEGLALLDRDADVDHDLRRIKQVAGELTGHEYLYWGIAAANLGKRREALAHLRRADELGVSGPLLAETQDALRRNRPGRGMADRYSYTHYTEWVGQEGIEAVLKLITHEEKLGRRDERAWAELLRRYPQLPMVFRKMLYEMDGEKAFDSALQMLGEFRTPAAIETIREFALGQQGTDDQRMQALRTLQEIGGLPDGATVEMWIKGERRTIQPVLQEISTDFRADYPEAAWAAYDEALSAHRAGRTDDAERAYRRMLAIEPNAKEAYNNLAVIYTQRGDIAAADMYLDKALAIDPLYAFPRTTRALRALNQDDIAGAKALLEPLHSVKCWHPQAMVSFQKTLARIAIAEKDYDAARSSLSLAERFSEDAGEVAALLEHLDLLAKLGGADSWFHKWDERYRQRREAKALPPDPTLADCLGLLTKGDMAGISRVLKIGSVSALKKAELQQRFTMLFSDPEFVARIVAGLTAEERGALQALLDQNGMMNRDQFVTAYGEEDERPYLEYHAEGMTGILGRLRAHGLVYIATVGKRVTVAVPRELRSHLARFLAADS